METIWNVIHIATALVTIASLIAVFTETQKDENFFIGKAQKLLDIVALNIGKAKQ